MRATPNVKLRTSKWLREIDKAEEVSARLSAAHLLIGEVIGEDMRSLVKGITKKQQDSEEGECERVKSGSRLNWE